MPLVEPNFKTAIDPDSTGPQALKRNRKRLFEDHPYCQVRADGCTTRSTVAHHIAGRRIINPHHKSNLLSVCDPCHRWVHRHPTESLAAGWMRSRVATPSPKENPNGTYQQPSHESDSQSHVRNA